MGVERPHAMDRGVVPKSLVTLVEDRARGLIDRKFSPSLPVLAEEAKHHHFNYPVEIYTRWRQRYFYICVKYRRQSDGDFFEVLTTRLEYAGGARFDLAYMRHTGKWCDVFPGLTVEECFEMVESMELFWPIH